MHDSTVVCKRKMVFKRKICAEGKAFVKFLCKGSDVHVPLKEILHPCCISQATIYHLLKVQKSKHSEQETWQASLNKGSAKRGRYGTLSQDFTSKRGIGIAFVTVDSE